MRRTLLRGLGALALGCSTSLAQAQPILPPPRPVLTTQPTFSAAPVGPVFGPLSGAPVGPALSGEDAGLAGLPGSALIPPEAYLGSAHDPINSGLTLGAGLYYVQPHWGENPAYSTLAAPGAPASTEDFDYSFSFAPRLFLGYICPNGWGGRVSWWHFDQSADAVELVNTGPPLVAPVPTPGPGRVVSSPGLLGPDGGDALAITGDLYLDVWDFDATKSFTAGCWSFLLGGGVRYAHLSQDYNGYLVTNGLPPGAYNTQELHASNTFSGAGPSGVLEVKRSFGKMGFAGYGNVRGGVLFGSGNRTAFARNASTSPAPTLPNGDLAVVGTRDDSLPFVEGELGCEYTCNIGAIQPFLRLGVVGQNWFGTGSGSSPVTGDYGDLSFFGLTFSLGTSF